MEVLYCEIGENIIMSKENKKILSREQLITALKNVLPKMDIVAPVKGIEGATHDLYPTKNLFFNQEEDILKFNITGEIDVKEIPSARRKTVVFGIRSCDVKGLEYTDLFFSGFKYKDDYYLKKRKNTILISMACVKPPLETCFCICANAGPFLESGFDIQLINLGNNFLVEIGSKKGQDFLEDAKVKSSNATKRDINKLEDIKVQADEYFETVGYFSKGIIQVTGNKVREELWSDFGEACINCGSCTHLCPMCTCFNVYERIEDENTGIRSRCWDSCQYSGYTREASGHNPRGEAKDRVKRRCYHKLSYYYMKMNNNFHGCIGCGRCVIGCPVFLDIPSILKRIRREGYIEKEETI